ncbi:helix-turn-helix domain-containing protein [Chryseobacterium sp. FH1]|uniref:helix-turn-helix domain-containing protein n=1 Tax=Chryseobacterium sp. FH1 TaxID=1233951 RepID=UPI0004E30C87|nr:helix-turn-helix domain-containing protein [Chryseobacterium sp. FH1]KFC20185.1 hypothetical protein IO90_13405 [Chryseobacterium sp. FH1]
MKFEFYKPKNELLRKYIEGYYFISPDENAEPLHYWTFPNNFFIFSINQNADIEINNLQIIVKQSKNHNIISDFVAKYTKPIEVIYEGAVAEVTIYFKPLGINQFVKNPEVFFKNILGLDFSPFEDLNDSMESIFKIKDREIQRKKLEEFWLSKLEEKDFSDLENIISDIESDFRIDDIAIKNNFSRQYLNRLFSKTIGKSPSEYRKIHRFRNAIINQKNQRNLTDLSLESSFYDQSHLIKDFKQLTNVSPNSFFKTVNTEKENVWLFI